MDALAASGRFADAVTMGEVSFARLHGLLPSGPAWWTALCLAHSHEVLGNWSRARELSAILMQTDASLERGVALCLLARIYVRLGRLDDAEALLHEARSVMSPSNPATLGPLRASDLLLVQALIACARGDMQSARLALQPVLDGVGQGEGTFGGRKRPWEWTWEWMAILETSRLVSGSNDAWRVAVQSAAELLPRAASLGDAWVSEVNARLEHGEGQHRVANWRSAVEAWQRIGARYDEAECRTQLAGVLLEAGDHSAAQEELTSALGLAKDLGAATLVADARTLARRGRLAIQGEPVPASPVAGLTVREVEVLRLIAHGYTNAQIGSELYISPKTASVHVSRVIAKLAVANRTEAARVAHLMRLVE